MAFTCRSSLLLFVMLASIVFVHGQQQQPAQAQQSKSQTPGPIPEKTAPSSMKCYQCNSVAKGEGDCQTSDPAKLKPFIKVCVPPNEGAFAGQVATSCRKVLQSVDEKSSVIRECAYTGEAVDGKRRTGNKGIILFLYQCFNTNNELPCNGASSASMIAWGVLMLTALAAVAFTNGVGIHRFF